MSNNNVNDTVLLQRQIMENSKSINQYMKELYDWEKDINKHDQIIKGESNRYPIPTNQTLNKDNIETSNANPQKDKSQDLKDKNENSKKLRRDINNMKDYYHEWDKFKVDSNDEGSDSESGKNSHNKGKVFKK